MAEKKQLVAYAAAYESAEAALADWTPSSSCIRMR